MMRLGDLGGGLAEVGHLPEERVWTRGKRRARAAEMKAIDPPLRRRMALTAVRMGDAAEAVSRACHAFQHVANRVLAGCGIRAVFSSACRPPGPTNPAGVAPVFRPPDAAAGD